jgi:hypothetical protein
VEAAIARIRANVAHLQLGDDPLFPTAILRGRRLVGGPLGDRPLLEAWRPFRARETGAVRYRWAVEPKSAGPLTAWVGPEDSWEPSRLGDAQAFADTPDRQPLFTARLITAGRAPRAPTCRSRGATNQRLPDGQADCCSGDELLRRGIGGGGDQAGVERGSAVQARGRARPPGRSVDPRSPRSACA